MFRRLQRRLDGTRDRRCNVVLKLEDVLEHPFEAIGPEMGPRLSVDQLGCHAHTIAVFPHAALGHVSHAEFAPDLLHVDGAALVGEARLPGYDEQPPHARQGRQNVLDHAVGKVFLLWVAAQVGKGQHGDRRPVGEWRKFCRGASWRISTGHWVRRCQSGLAERAHQGLGICIRLQIELALQEGDKMFVTPECVCSAPCCRQCPDRQAMRVLAQVVDRDRPIGGRKSLLGGARLQFQVA